MRGFAGNLLLLLMFVLGCHRVVGYNEVIFATALTSMLSLGGKRSDKKNFRLGLEV